MYYHPISENLQSGAAAPNTLRSLAAKYGGAPIHRAEAARNSGMLRMASGKCTCTCRENRVCCLNLQQATLVSGFSSVIFSLLIFAHEIALEGGFNLRNYVVLAFCIVWLIVTSLLSVGAYKRAHFMILPWMILTSVLMPLFIIGIVAGCRVIVGCINKNSHSACLHEFHLFGTNNHICSIIKLFILTFMTAVTGLAFGVVYRYFFFLTSTENWRREHEGALSDDSATLHYDRFQDEEDPETNMPLCEHEDEADSRESIT